MCRDIGRILLILGMSQAGRQQVFAGLVRSRRVVELLISWMRQRARPLPFA